MATASVQEFLDQVGQDPALQGDLMKALDADNDRESVTALAQTKGYEFSSDELWAEVQNRQAALQASGELSEEDLEAVAGGVTLTFIHGVASVGGGLAIPRTQW